MEKAVVRGGRFFSMRCRGSLRVLLSVPQIVKRQGQPRVMRCCCGPLLVMRYGLLSRSMLSHLTATDFENVVIRPPATIFPTNANW